MKRSPSSLRWLCWICLFLSSLAVLQILQFDSAVKQYLLRAKGEDYYETRAAGEEQQPEPSRQRLRRRILTAAAAVVTTTTDDDKKKESSNTTTTTTRGAAAAGVFPPCLDEQVLHQQNSDWTIFSECARTLIASKNNKQLSLELEQALLTYKMTLWHDEDDDDEEVQIAHATDDSSRRVPSAIENTSRKTPTFDESPAAPALAATATPERHESIANKVSARAREEETSRSRVSVVTSSPPATKVRGLRLVFVGDSLTRYMYLSLVYFLRHGHWEELPTNKGQPSMVLEKTHASWMGFFNYTNAQLHPYEQCDCFRFESAGAIPRHMFENRYYWDPVHNNSVVYLQKFGHVPAHGHWTPNQVRQQQPGAFHEAKKPVPAKWSYNWTSLISDHVAKLEPKPTHVVFNAAKWEDQDLSQASAISGLKSALEDAGIVGIYKTTSHSSYPRFTTKLSPAVEQLLCHAMHHCLDLDWTKRVAPAFRWDYQHFTEPIYRIMNEQLLTNVLSFEDLSSVIDKTTQQYLAPPYGQDAKNKTELWNFGPIVPPPKIPKKNK